MTPLADSAQQLMDLCTQAGAQGSQVEIILSHRWRVGCCQGKVETDSQRKTLSIGLTFFKAGRCVTVSGQRCDTESLQRMVTYAHHLSKVLPEDPWKGLASLDQLAESVFLPTWEPLLDSLCDTEVLHQAVQTCEAAALAVKDVVISEGADMSVADVTHVLASSQGRFYENHHRVYSLGVSVVAKDAEGSYRGSYDHASSNLAGLEKPEDIGRTAGLRAAAQRGAKPLPFSSKSVPVVYDPEAAVSLVEHALQALSGPAHVEKKTFWLKELDTLVWPTTLSLWEEPCHPLALVPRPFDGEGLPANRQAFIEHGYLRRLILDLTTSRRLGLSPTGNGGSPLDSGLSVGTLVMQGGQGTAEALMADIQEGVYVTHLMGQGVNVWTGDYSRGAMGFWIHEGRIAHPLKGITLAGNLPEMFRSMQAADDVRTRENIFVPTVRLQSLQVSGGT